MSTTDLARRDQTPQEKLLRELARNNTIMNAALSGSDIQVFELRSDGMLRLLSPGMGWSEQMTGTLGTPRQMLAQLHCSVQWESAFIAALEQAALGQPSEVEFQTLDEEERWIQLCIEPLANDPDTEAIGTIRNVTEAVMERHRAKAESKLLNRMMSQTVSGMEVSLEDNTWKMLWGMETYGHLLQSAAEPSNYTYYVNEQVAPIIHPRDRDRVCAALDRKVLLGAYLTGTERQVLEYRVKTDQPPGYEWHSIDMYLFREAVSRQIKGNFFVRRVDESRRRELEERRQLEEKEQALLLRAKRLGESETELDFVQVIADYYQGIYVVNLNDDETRSIKIPNYFMELLEKENNRLSPTLARYCREYMEPAFAPAFFNYINYTNLRRSLRDGRQEELTYQKKDGTWITMRVLPMPGYSPTSPVTLWIFEDDTETVNLRREEEKARVSARAAEAASLAKSQFLANMSHEIRTPLNAILGMSELALRESGPKEKDDCLMDIRSSGRILLENINSILDLSKIEAGKMEIIPQNYRILTTLHDALTVLGMRAREKELDFVVEVSEDIPSVLYGDNVSLSHIIMNLGSNAVKYTPSGSVTLTITWETEERDVEDGCLVIHVEDTGVGIKPLDMPYIFESYGRLENGPNRHIEGTGLGLPICQMLTRLMGGQLGVQSTYGVGSDFWVSIPQKIVDATPCGPYGTTPPRENASDYHTFTAPECVVLLVDDQEINRKVCRGLLRPYGMELVEAGSGQEALNLVTQIWPDLILLDHMMPDMDGVEVAKRIRKWGEKNPCFALVPIVALTANAMKGARETFLASGFNDFLSKPIELDRLDTVLRAWLPEDKLQPVVSADAPPAPEPLPEDLRDLPGINGETGMGYCGTAELYRKTLLTFRDQLPGRLDRLNAALSGGDLDSYVIEAHSLKSAARWIGAEEAGSRAERLEQAAKESQRDTLEQEGPGLAALCRTLLEGLQAL